MTRILLVRHGHVPGIAPAQFRGRTNLELTPHGLAQARATAHRIAQSWRPEMIYTSPLQRCLMTGRLISEATGTRSQVLDDLNDLDYGKWQGQTHTAVRERVPAEYALWRNSPDLVRFPEGESLQDLALRAADVLRFVIERHAEGTIVLVGHDAGIRALLLQSLGLPLSAYWRITPDPAALCEIVWAEGRLSVVRMNETAHLTGLVPSDE